MLCYYIFYTSTAHDQAALTGTVARQTNNIVNTVAYYDIQFTTAASGTIKRVEVVFPAGTITSGARVIEVEGLGPGSLSKTGTTLTYVVTNPVNVPAGTNIRIEYGNIVNPPPGTTYFVTVTTIDPTNGIIDGPTQSSTYSIKRISTDSIGPNAITTSKIAPGAVTSDKIANGAVSSQHLSPAYTYKVILLDDANGNAKGWNPGGFSFFHIVDPLIDPARSTVIVNVIAASGTGIPAPCSVTWMTLGTEFDPRGFSIGCSLNGGGSPGGVPQDGSALVYTVFQNPSTP